MKKTIITGVVIAVVCWIVGFGLDDWQWWTIAVPFSIVAAMPQRT